MLLQVRDRTRSPVPMAARVFPVCERGMKPVPVGENIMEILLHEARNGTNPQWENPRGITLLLLLCLVLLLAVWNRDDRKSSIPGPVSLTAHPHQNTGLLSLSPLYYTLSNGF